MDYSSNNRSVPDIFNMLQFLSRRNYMVANNYALHKIRYFLCTADKYNIHTSVVNLDKKPTTASNLPKLPIPDLKDTIKKYLETCKPILQPEEYYNTQKIATDFTKSGSAGQELQKFLIQKAEYLDNWLETYWLHTAYLGYRLPVVIHSSPGLIFPFQTFNKPDDQVTFAAKLILTAISFKNEIDKENIPQEYMGKDPLDMGQYKKIFGTCRIPQQGIDGLVYNSTSNHIVIACNNHFFKLCVNKNHSLKHIIDQLNAVRNLSQETVHPVGILSSDERDVWAEKYKLLTKDPCNACSVDEIENALFLVCLDSAIPLIPTNKNRLTLAAEQTLHGGGSKYNGGNRWFDKTIQFVVSSDGISGMTYEHAPSDGQPIAVMTDYMINNLDKVGHGTECGPNIEKLNFKVDCPLENAIMESSCHLNELVEDTDMVCNVYTKYGKNFIKQNKMSPDSYIQMAMQLAYYRLYSKPAAHYESAATRKYIGGRTETIRSCSIEAVKFARAMLDSTVPEPTKKKLLLDAVNEHKRYAVDALNGHGIDRHLLGLKLIAREKSMRIPEFFRDPGFTKTIHFQLSSSQVAFKCTSLMCYGAVVPDGFSLCYNPRADDIYFSVGSFNSCASTKSRLLVESFEQTLDDMHYLLCKTAQSKL